MRPGGGGTDPADWTDYRLETTVGIDATATDPDARAGVVVRYDAASGSHLRYELNRHTDRRQLQLVTSDGRVTLAAVDGFDATPAADYRIAVEVVGTDVRVYEDGAFVLDADLAGHGALASGSVGFLTACEATFGELRVDDVSTAAPTPYRFAFTTSRFANFGHQVGSYDDETWHVDASSSLPLGGGAGIRAASPDAQVSPDATEGRTYEAVVDALDRPRRGLPARIEVTRVAGMDGTPVGLLVESPEPIDWPRTTLSLNRTAASPPVVRPPTGVKLVAATLAGDQEVDVLLREATDLSGYEIEFRRDGTASGFAPALGDGFEEGFEDSLDDYRAPIGELDWWHVDEPDEDEDGDAELVLDTTVDGGTAPTDATLVRRGHTQSDGGWRATVAVGDGERVGLTFRYRSPTANYRFVVGPDGRALVRVDGGIGSTLWEHEAPVDAGDVVKLTVIAAEGHLRGSVDGVPAFTIVDPDPSVAGSVGIAVERATSARVVDLEAGREVAESVCLEERWGRALESTMWTPVDEPPDTTRESEWVVASGELQQRSNIYGFAGGEYRAPGTHIHPGTGESWTDYRVTLSLQSDDDDAIGLLFRRRDASNYYRFSMDRERGYRRLVKVVDGETTLLWADGWSFEAGREYLLSIACVGDRITGALDGEALFSVVDGTHAAGTVAPYCRANRAARFGTIRVVVSADNWIPLYRFEETESLPAGSVLRLHESTVASRTGAGIYSRRLGTGGMGPRMPTSAVELRVVGPDGPEHERSFNPATTYARVSDVSLLRSADGTGVFVHPAGGLDAGGYRLAFTYRRDADEGPTLTQAGDDGPEFGTVDVPWETVREADRSETDG